MSEVVQEFVRSHPEFFKKTGDYYVLRSDIDDLVKQYARILDNDEYERVRALVESIRKENEEQREHDIRYIKDEINRLKSSILKIGIQSDEQEDILLDIKQRIAGIRAELANLSNAKNPWYHSNIVFLLLMGSGLVMMYIGITIHVNTASNFFFLGAFQCLLGVVLQERKAPMCKNQGAKISQLREEHDQLISKKQLAKIKRVTFVQQISVAKQGIQNLLVSLQ
tara:strand:- start:12577 stop:13248 length:672 start_codon:yes stop_codon:yes gene_type:complete